MKKGLRGVAVITLVCFLTTQSVWGAPGVGIEIAPQHEMPTALSIDVPAELGTVDALYEAPGAAHPQFILHIQNAHANYQAQMKIKQLLEHMNKKYGFQTIFIEGAAEKLNPDYLKLFPDQKENEEFCDSLAKQGELTGAELFLMEESGTGKGSSVEGLGIEQTALYRSNYDALKKVFGAETDVNRFFSGFDSKLDRVASKTFTPETRQLIADWKRFEQGRREFMPFVRDLAKKSKKVLNVDLESLFAQVNWPQISRLLVIQQMERDLDKAKGLEEKNMLLGRLRSRNISKELLAALESFNEGSISIGKSSQEVLPRQLMENLSAEAGPQGFKFSDYPAFSLFAGYVILRSELDPKALFEEIEYLFTRVLDTLAPEPQQKTLLALYRDGELLRKLLRLELSRTQWRTLMARKDQVTVAVLVGRLRDAVLASGDTSTQKGQEVMPPAFKEKMTGLFSAGLEFYDFARRREGAFYQEIQTAMAERKITKAVLITGGFHTDGMSDIFRENAISYGIVTPRLSEKSNEKMYRGIMMGKHPGDFDVSYLEAVVAMQSPQVQFDQQGFADISAILNEFMAKTGIMDRAKAVEVFKTTQAYQALRAGDAQKGIPGFDVVQKKTEDGKPAVDELGRPLFGLEKLTSTPEGQAALMVPPAVTPAKRSESRLGDLTAQRGITPQKWNAAKKTNVWDPDDPDAWVLLVEDDIIRGKLLARGLESVYGVGRVVLARTVDEALDQIASRLGNVNARQPYRMILDNTLVGSSLSGQEFVQGLVDEGYEAAVVMQTSESADVKTALSATLKEKTPEVLSKTDFDRMLKAGFPQFFKILGLPSKAEDRAAVRSAAGGLSGLAKVLTVIAALVPGFLRGAPIAETNTPAPNAITAQAQPGIFTNVSPGLRVELVPTGESVTRTAPTVAEATGVVPTAASVAVTNAVIPLITSYEAYPGEQYVGVVFTVDPNANAAVKGFKCEILTTKNLATPWQVSGSFIYEEPHGIPEGATRAVSLHQNLAGENGFVRIRSTGIPLVRSESRGFLGLLQPGSFMEGALAPIALAAIGGAIGFLVGNVIGMMSPNMSRKAGVTGTATAVGAIGGFMTPSIVRGLSGPSFSWSYLNPFSIFSGVPFDGFLLFATSVGAVLAALWGGLTLWERYHPDSYSRAVDVARTIPAQVAGFFRWRINNQAAAENLRNKGTATFDLGGSVLSVAALGVPFRASMHGDFVLFEMGKGQGLGGKFVPAGLQAFPQTPQVGGTLYVVRTALGIEFVRQPREGMASLLKLEAPSYDPRKPRTTITLTRMLPSDPGFSVEIRRSESRDEVAIREAVSAAKSWDDLLNALKRNFPEGTEAIRDEGVADFYVGRSASPDEVDDVLELIRMFRDGEADQENIPRAYGIRDAAVAIWEESLGGRFRGYSAQQVRDGLAQAESKEKLFDWLGKAFPQPDGKTAESENPYFVQGSDGAKFFAKQQVAIEGSNDLNDLSEIINRVMVGTARLTDVPRTYGLRDIVAKLLERSKSAAQVVGFKPLSLTSEPAGPEAVDVEQHPAELTDPSTNPLDFVRFLIWGPKSQPLYSSRVENILDNAMEAYGQWMVGLQPYEGFAPQGAQEPSSNEMAEARRKSFSDQGLEFQGRLANESRPKSGEIAAKKLDRGDVLLAGRYLLVIRSIAGKKLSYASIEIGENGLTLIPGEKEGHLSDLAVTEVYRPVSRSESRLMTRRSFFSQLGLAGAAAALGGVPALGATVPTGVSEFFKNQRAIRFRLMTEHPIVYEKWTGRSLKEVAEFLGELGTFNQSLAGALDPVLLERNHAKTFRTIHEKLIKKGMAQLSGDTFPSSIGSPEYVDFCHRLIMGDLARFFAKNGLVVTLNRIEARDLEKTRSEGGLETRSVSQFPIYQLPERYFAVSDTVAVPGRAVPAAVVTPIGIVITPTTVGTREAREVFDGGEHGFTYGDSAFVCENRVQVTVDRSTAMLEKLDPRLFFGKGLTYRDALKGIRIPSSVPNRVQVIGYPSSDVSGAAGYAGTQLMGALGFTSGLNFDVGRYTDAMNVSIGAHEFGHMDMDQSANAAERVVSVMAEGRSNPQSLGVSREDADTALTLSEMKARLATLEKTPVAYLQALMGSVQAGWTTLAKRDRAYWMADYEIYKALIQSIGKSPDAYGITLVRGGEKITTEFGKTITVSEEAQILFQLGGIAKDPAKLARLSREVNEIIGLPARINALGSKEEYKQLDPKRSESRLMEEIEQRLTESLMAADNLGPRELVTSEHWSKAYGFSRVDAVIAARFVQNALADAKGVLGGSSFDELSNSQIKQEILKRLGLLQGVDVERPVALERSLPGFLSRIFGARSESRDVSQDSFIQYELALASLRADRSPLMPSEGMKQDMVSFVVANPDFRRMVRREVSKIQAMAAGERWGDPALARNLLYALSRSESRVLESEEELRLLADDLQAQVNELIPANTPEARERVKFAVLRDGVLATGVSALFLTDPANGGYTPVHLKNVIGARFSGNRNMYVVHLEKGKQKISRIQSSLIIQQGRSQLFSVRDIDPEQLALEAPDVFVWFGKMSPQQAARSESRAESVSLGQKVLKGVAAPWRAIGQFLVSWWAEGMMDRYFRLSSAAGLTPSQIERAAADNNRFVKSFSNSSGMVDLVMKHPALMGKVLGERLRAFRSDRSRAMSAIFTMQMLEDRILGDRARTGRERRQLAHVWNVLLPYMADLLANGGSGVNNSEPLTNQLWRAMEAGYGFDTMSPAALSAKGIVRKHLPWASDGLTYGARTLRAFAELSIPDELEAMTPKKAPSVGVAEVRTPRAAARSESRPVSREVKPAAVAPVVEEKPRALVADRQAEAAKALADAKLDPKVTHVLESTATDAFEKMTVDLEAKEAFLKASPEMKVVMALTWGLASAENLAASIGLLGQIAGLVSSGTAEGLLERVRAAAPNAVIDVSSEKCVVATIISEIGDVEDFARGLKLVLLFNPNARLLFLDTGDAFERQKADQVKLIVASWGKDINNEKIADQIRFDFSSMADVIDMKAIAAFARRASSAGEKGKTGFVFAADEGFLSKLDMVLSGTPVALAYTKDKKNDVAARILLARAAQLLRTSDAMTSAASILQKHIPNIGIEGGVVSITNTTLMTALANLSQIMAAFESIDKAA